MHHLSNTPPTSCNIGMLSPEAHGSQTGSSSVFLLHVALELPFALQSLLMAEHLPFLEMTNTTLVVLKIYGALAIGTCVGAVLCRSLPEFLPGKRAMALSLLVYHAIAAATLMTSPRFVPLSFGPLAESLTITPERSYAVLHGLAALGFASWWQVTLPYVAAAKGKFQ
ncbi:hypothetical protein DACRYDRAFT_88793 [Dacryopinax primogenitus]|uniref:Uncharacterized protein n=1 Tax=Dacryopinax primogenitus (strain DJM 731) TaxID=1858805 RepID=M5FWU4_DACPD|nr:uncharacterized protein DACRYDRAFT_88793 [Dacryopinax primogenitus]EJU02441.1 hypothetical protein DACRYDRAFT_88793 [Dacryopinax primogenitus]